MKKEDTLLGIKELAKLAQVSIGTIDRVLHNRPGVAAKTKEKVVAVLAQHNYQPNLIARALASRKTKRIIALIPKDSAESAYWQFPRQGIKKAAQEIQAYSFQVTLCFFDQNDRESFVQEAANLIKEQFDGLVVAPMFRKESQPLLDYCESQEIPYIFINADLAEAKNVSYFGPDLFQSGAMAAQLIKYLVQPQDEVLLVHISKEMETQHHLLRKEEGLISYMQANAMPQKLHKLTIRDTDYYTVQTALKDQLSNSAIRLILVTNSRVATVAKFLEESDLSQLLLLGFDYLPENIVFLKKGLIDFLFCHKPIAQGYQAIMSLFQLLESNKLPQPINHMPIDVISKENYCYYEN